MKYMMGIKNLKLWNKSILWENKTELMQHILKIQYISLLPKYIKLISNGVFHVHTCTQMQVIQKCMYHTHTKQHSSVIKWDEWLRVLNGSHRIFLFSIIPNLLLSWYRENTLTTLLQIHLKLIMHVTLPEFAPMPIHRFILMQRGHFTFILTKKFALHKANNRYTIHNFLILFQDTFLQTQHELIFQY
jgi:hypothetical protein